MLRGMQAQGLLLKAFKDGKVSLDLVQRVLCGKASLNETKKVIGPMVSYMPRVANWEKIGVVIPASGGERCFGCSLYVKNRSCGQPCRVQSNEEKILEIYPAFPNVLELYSITVATQTMAAFSAFLTAPAVPSGLVSFENIISNLVCLL